MPTLQNYGNIGRFAAEAEQYPDWTLARVVAEHKGLYRVVTEAGECAAEVSGRFRYEAERPDQYPAVGDYCMASQEAPDDPVILHRVLPRKSVFTRTAVGVTGQIQVVAANIDVVFLCMSLNQNFNLSRLERYLSIAWDSGATPVVLLTKADLCDDLAARLAEVERVAGVTDVVVTSALDGAAADRVLAYIKPGTTASLIGSSGVGKSTLINLLLGEEALATATLGHLDKGRHTTTSREMLLLPNGGIVIDTPGMREIGVENADLAKSFADIEALARQCRFSDCTHTSEPGCAVRQAIAEGKLDERRLANFEKIKREAKYDGLDARKLESAKAEAMFKDVGGMKNVRKYIRETNKRK